MMFGQGAFVAPPRPAGLTRHDQGVLSEAFTAWGPLAGFVPCGFVPGSTEAAWGASLAAAGVPLADREDLRLIGTAEGQAKGVRNLRTLVPWVNGGRGGEYRRICGRGAPKDLATIRQPDGAWIALCMTALEAVCNAGKVPAAVVGEINERLRWEGVLVGLKEDGSESGTHLHTTSRVGPGGGVWVFDRLIARALAGAPVPRYWEIKLSADAAGNLRAEVIDYLALAAAGIRSGALTTKGFPAVRREPCEVNGVKGAGTRWRVNANTPSIRNDPAARVAWFRGEPRKGVDPLPFLASGTLIPR